MLGLACAALDMWTNEHSVGAQFALPWLALAFHPTQAEDLLWSSEIGWFVVSARSWWPTPS